MLKTQGFLKNGLNILDIFSPIMLMFKNMARNGGCLVKLSHPWKKEYL